MPRQHKQRARMAFVDVILHPDVISHVIAHLEDSDVSALALSCVAAHVAAANADYYVAECNTHPRLLLRKNHKAMLSRFAQRLRDCGVAPRERSAWMSDCSQWLKSRRDGELACRARYRVKSVINECDWDAYPSMMRMLHVERAIEDGDEACLRDVIRDIDRKMQRDTVMHVHTTNSGAWGFIEITSEWARGALYNAAWYSTQKNDVHWVVKTCRAWLHDLYEQYVASGACGMYEKFEVYCTYMCNASMARRYMRARYRCHLILRAEICVVHDAIAKVTNLVSVERYKNDGGGWIKGLVVCE
jgi:hypothetical protein